MARPPANDVNAWWFLRRVPSWGRRRSVRHALKQIVDATLVAFAVVVAYGVRFERIPTGTYGVQLLVLLAVLPPVRVLVWRTFGIYDQSWRLFGLREAIALTITTVATSLLVLCPRLFSPFVPRVAAVPLGVVALEGMGTLVGMHGVRALARRRDERRPRRSPSSRKRVLLVGADRAGHRAVRELRARADLDAEIVGFLDDDPERRHLVIEGVRVLGTVADAASLARRTDADAFVLTQPGAASERMRIAAARCRETGLPVHVVALGRMRPLAIEDLLVREPATFDADAAARVRVLVADRVVAVTGAGGSVGRELCRQFAALRPHTLVMIENHENDLFEVDNEVHALLGERAVACLIDVRDREAVERTFERTRPSLVIHAAAFKHGPMMEAHPVAAVENNVFGTVNVLAAARRHGATRFVLVSSDEAVRPTNVMAATKRVAELVVHERPREGGLVCCSVRFGNLLDGRGSVLSLFERQIDDGGPVTVTHPEMRRVFVSVAEVVRRMLHVAAWAEGGEVFVLDMGEPLAIAEIARQMIALRGEAAKSVAIECVGLRPGETLTPPGHGPHELEPIGMGGIGRVRAGMETGRTASLLASLRRAIDEDDPERIRGVLAEIAPGLASPSGHASP